MQKILWCVLAAILTAGVLLNCISGAMITASAKSGNGLVCSVKTKEKRIALSFDTADGTDYTEQIMNILETNHISATFFVTGDWVQTHPEQLTTLYQRGFEIGNHSEHHVKSSVLTEAQLRYEITSVNSSVYQAVGAMPTLFRPPFGDGDDITVAAAASMGLTTVNWSLDSGDYKDDATATDIRKTVLNNVRPGDIVLLHCNAMHTPDALSGIVEGLQAKGYVFYTVSGLLSQSSQSTDAPVA